MKGCDKYRKIYCIFYLKFINLHRIFLYSIAEKFRLNLFLSRILKCDIMIRHECAKNTHIMNSLARAQ